MVIYKKRHGLRILAICTIVTLGLMVAVAGIFHVLLFTEMGQDFLSRQITAQLSESGYKIELGEISGTAPSPLRLSSITLKDKEGELVTLNNIQLEWSPYALLRGQLTIEKLAAEKIILHRMPASSEKKSPPNFDFSVPAMPIGFNIEKLNLNHIDLTPLFQSYGKRSYIYAFDADGLGYDLFSNTWRGRLAVTENHDNASSLLLDIINPPETKNTALKLTLKDQGQGILALMSNHQGSVINIDLDAKGSGKKWDGDVHVDFGKDVKGKSTFSIKKDRKSQGVIFDLATTLESPQIPLKDHQLDTKLTAVFQKDQIALKSLSLNAEELKAGYEGNFTLTAQKILGSGALHLNTLSPLTLSPDFSYEGQNKANLVIKGDWNALDVNLEALLNLKNYEKIKNVDLQFKTHLQLMSYLTSDLKADVSSHLLLQNIEGDVPVHIQGATLDFAALYEGKSEQLAFKKMGLKSPGLALEGSLLVKEGGIDKCNVSGGIHDLSALIAAQDNQLKGAFDIDITRASAQDFLKADVVSKNLQYGAMDVDPIQLSLTQQQNDFFVECRLGREVNPIAANMVITTGKDFVKFSALKIDDMTDQINGELLVDTEKGTYEGYLNGGLSRFAPLTKLFGIKGGNGKASLDCKFVPRGNSTELDLLIKLQDFKTKDLSLKLGLLKADLEFDKENAFGQFSATLFDGNYQDWNFKQIKTQANGRLQEFDYDFAVKSLMPMAATFDANGRVNLSSEEGRKIELDQFKGRILEKAVELLDPLSLTLSEAETVLSPCVFKIGYGEINAYLRQDDTTIDAYTKLDGLPLALLSFIDPTLQIDGALSGEISMSGNKQNPEAKIDFTYDNVDFALNSRSQAKFFGSTTGTLSQKQFDLKGHLTSQKAKDSPLRFSLSSQIDFESGLPVLNPDAPFKTSLTGDLQLADFIVFWPLENDALQGDLRFNFGTAGSLNKLSFDGNLTLENGYYGSGEFGTELNNLQATLLGQNDELILETLSASADSGRLQGKGKLKLAQDYPYQFDLNMTDYPLVMNDEMEFIGSVALHAEGGGKRRDQIKGKIDLTSATYTLPKDISTELKDIFDIEEEQPEQHFSSQTEMNVELNLLNPLLIKGWGVDSTWRGSLIVGGSLGVPTLSGKVSLRQGEFKLLGPIFKLTRGEITFVPSEQINPLLDIRAETEKDEVKAIISVTGDTNSPKLSLNSQPELPQEEILSKILFSESTANLSPYQAVKIATIAGSFGGVNIPLLGQLESISSTLGFDSFEIGSGESGGTAPVVKFGKRISNRVKASFEEDVEQGKTQGKLEVELTPHVVLESGLSSGGDSGSGGNLGIVGKWEY